MVIKKSVISDPNFWTNLYGENPKYLTRITENNVVSSLKYAKNGKWTCVNEELRYEILSHVKAHEKSGPIWVKDGEV